MLTEIWFQLSARLYFIPMLRSLANMANRTDTLRPHLTVSLVVAKSKIQKQIEAAPDLRGLLLVPHQRDPDGKLRTWYEYTEELLRSICTTDDLANEFTGRGEFSSGSVDLNVEYYLRKLTSILKRLELIPVNLKAQSDSIVTHNESALSSATAILEKLARRLHRVARQLKQRHDSRPTLEISDEYDLQDLFHALLRIDFDDVRPEEWAPSYAGTASRMDFLLKSESTVVEMKKTRKGLGAREVTDQLIIDIARYQQHQYCKVLVCIVYDPEERIANPTAIESDLSKKHGSLAVKVFVVQR